MTERPEDRLLGWWADQDETKAVAEAVIAVARAARIAERRLHGYPQVVELSDALSSLDSLADSEVKT